MRKIKFLKDFITVLIIGYVINYLESIYLSIYPAKFMGFSDEIYEGFLFGRYTQFIGMAISVFTFIGLIYIKRALNKILKNGYFSFDTAKKLKTAGNLFIGSGILSLLFNILLFQHKQSLHLITWMSKDFLFLILGFNLIIIADFIDKGNQIQQENDLTI
jgi:hypothetical protein